MEILVKNIREIRKNHKLLEKKLNIKFNIIGKKVILEDKQPEEFVAEKVILALNANFPIDEALILLDENFMLEEINIKEITNKADLVRVRARIIGAGGRTLELMEELSDCYFKLNDNTVSIIGSSEEIKNATNALIRLVKGSKQANVYSYLEKQRRIVRPEDLGLKDKHSEEE